jgi:hypothetical protein
LYEQLVRIGQLLPSFLSTGYILELRNDAMKTLSLIEILVLVRDASTIHVAERLDANDSNVENEITGFYEVFFFSLFFLNIFYTVIDSSFDMIFFEDGRSTTTASGATSATSSDTAEQRTTARTKIK